MFDQQNPLLDRFAQILQSEAAPLLLFLLALAVGVMVLAILLQGYRLLLLALLLGQMFSAMGGAGQGILTLMRFGALFALAILGVSGVTGFRFPHLAMLGYAGWLLVLSAHSIVTGWSLQFAGAFMLLVIGLGGATIRYVTEFTKAEKALAVVACAALVWTMVNALVGESSGIRSTGVGRYEGVLGRTGSMAGVGGFLPPFLLWGFLRTSWKRIYRYICLGGLLVVLPMLVLVGQRIGLFAALIGITPLVWFRLNAKRLLGGVFALAAATVVSLVMISAAPRHTQEYLLNKYIYRVGYLSGRDVRWRTIFGMCMQNPVLGHGAGTADLQATLRFGSGTHNSYIAMLYDGGVITLGTWLLVASYSMFRAFTLMSGHAPPEWKEMARLLLGCLLALSAQGFFESGLNSPTNLNAGLFLLSITMVECLRRLQTETRYALPGYGWGPPTEGVYRPRLQHGY